MKILIACEESQKVCTEFRKLGHEAYSCDIQEPSGGHPEWHINDDVLPLLNGNCTFHTMDGVEHSVIGKWDMLVSFPPCFIAGTLIMTFDGLKNIEDIEIGDKVLTHTGLYKEVKSVMRHPASNICKVTSFSQGEITCTSNHRFYCKTKDRHFSNGKYAWNISDFSWLSVTDFSYASKSKNQRTLTSNVCDDIIEQCKWGGTDIKLNSNSTKHVANLDVNDPNFWYIVGRYLGDGYLHHKKRKNQTFLYGIYICSGRHKSEYLKEKLNLAMKKSKFSYAMQHKRTADCFEISSSELGKFMEQFGAHSFEKCIPGFVTRLPKECVDQLLAGYLDCDGYLLNGKKQTFSTTSKKLAYGIKYIVQKYFGLSCSVYKKEQHNNVIEGRVVNTRDIYLGSFMLEKSDRSKYFIDGKYILAPVRSVEKLNETDLVYNLSVEDDESYTADGFVVHNCTHLAISGAMHFEKKRNDGRQIDAIEFFCQFMQADCDRILIENPRNIISGGEYIKTHFPDLCEKYGIPKKESQTIQPWMFGDPHCKTTCLWLKGLPNLVPEITEEPETEWVEYVSHKTGKKKRMQKWFYDAFMEHHNSNEDRSRVRSKTFDGIARAIAQQYSDFCSLSEEDQKKQLIGSAVATQKKLF